MRQVHQQPFVVLFASCESPAGVVCFLRVEIHLEKFDAIFTVKTVVFSVGIKQAKFSAVVRATKYKSAGRLGGGGERIPV